MNTYFTKSANGLTYHFRAELGEHWVRITEGIFYHWLHNHIISCGDHQSAIIKQQELIDKWLSAGFQQTSFTESPENTVDVYDKAKWHIDGEFPADLDPFQGYVHTGLFLGWLIDNNLVSEEFSEEIAKVYSLFRLRKITGPQIFEEYLDGTLKLEDLNEEGNKFALRYFYVKNGEYFRDYATTLASDLPSVYHVENSWENYDKLKIVLDKRYKSYQSKFRNPS